jgi:hypothetical protein
LFVKKPGAAGDGAGQSIPIPKPREAGLYTPLTPPDPQLKGAWYPGGFNPCTYHVKTRFQSVPFRFINVRRYGEGGGGDGGMDWIGSSLHGLQIKRDSDGHAKAPNTGGTSAMGVKVRVCTFHV